MLKEPEVFRRLRKRLELYTKTDLGYVFSSGIWSNASTVTVSLGSLLLYVAFGHFVSKESYGTYQYLLSLGSIVAAFTLTGMNTAVSRAVARGYEGALRQAIGIQLKWNLVPLAGAWLCSLYYFYFGNVVLGSGLILIGIFVPIMTTLNTYSAYLNGKKDFKRGFILSLWWTLPYYLGSIAVAYLFHAPIPLLLSYFIFQTIGLYIAYVQTLKAYAPTHTPDVSLPKFGAHLSIMGLFSSVASQLDSVMAFHFLGPAGLAIYSFATAIPDRMIGLLKFLPSAALPRFSENSEAHTRAGIWSRLVLSVASVILVAISYALIAPHIYILLFPAYIEAAIYSQIYVLVIISIITNIITTALSAHNQIKKLYIFNTAIPVIQVLAQFFGIIFFGIWGLVLGRVLTSITGLSLALLLLGKQK